MPNKETVYAPIEDIKTVHERLDILKVKEKREFYRISCKEDFFVSVGKEYLLLKAKIPNREIAEICEVSTQAVNQWFVGSNIPKPIYLAILCKMFNVSTDWILCKDNTTDRVLNNEAEIFIKYGFSPRAFENLRLMKEHNLDMSKTMFGLNKILEFTEDANAIDLYQEKWNKVLYALSDFFYLYKDGKKQYYDTAPTDDLLSKTYHHLFARKNDGPLDLGNLLSTLLYEINANCKVEKEPHESDIEALLVLQEKLKQCKGELVKEQVSKLIEEYYTYYSKHYDEESARAANQYNALKVLNKYYNNIDGVDLQMGKIEYDNNSESSSANSTEDTTWEDIEKNLNQDS